MSQSRPAFGNAMLSVAGRAQAAQAPAPTPVAGISPWSGMQGLPWPQGWVPGPAWPGGVGQPMPGPAMGFDPHQANSAPVANGNNAGTPLDAAFARLLRALGSLGPNESQMLAAVAAFVGEHFGAASESQREVMSWASRLDSNRPAMNYARGPVLPPAEQVPGNSGGFRPYVLGRTA